MKKFFIMIFLWTSPLLATETKEVAVQYDNKDLLASPQEFKEILFKNIKFIIPYIDTTNLTGLFKQNEDKLNALIQDMNAEHNTKNTISLFKALANFIPIFAPDAPVSKILLSFTTNKGNLESLSSGFNGMSLEPLSQTIDSNMEKASKSIQEKIKNLYSSFHSKSTTFLKTQNLTKILNNIKDYLISHPVFIDFLGKLYTEMGNSKRSFVWSLLTDINQETENLRNHTFSYMNDYENKEKEVLQQIKVPVQKFLEGILKSVPTTIHVSRTNTPLGTTYYSHLPSTPVSKTNTNPEKNHYKTGHKTMDSGNETTNETKEDQNFKNFGEFLSNFSSQIHRFKPECNRLFRAPSIKICEEKFIEMKDHIDWLSQNFAFDLDNPDKRNTQATERTSTNSFHTISEEKGHNTRSKSI